MKTDNERDNERYSLAREVEQLDPELMKRVRSMHRSLMEEQDRMVIGLTTRMSIGGWGNTPVTPVKLTLRQKFNGAVYRARSFLASGLDWLADKVRGHQRISEE